MAESVFDGESLPQIFIIAHEGFNSLKANWAFPEAEKYLHCIIVRFKEILDQGKHKMFFQSTNLITFRRAIKRSVEYVLYIYILCDFTVGHPTLLFRRHFTQCYVCCYLSTRCEATSINN